MRGEKSDFWRRQWTRRRFVQGSATAGVGTAAIFAGCGGDDDDDTSNGGNTPADGNTPQPGTTPDAGAPKLGGRIQAYNTEPDQYDPHRDAGYPGLTVMASVYNALLRTRLPIGEDFVIEPDLTDSLPEQPDELTYVFKIADNAAWHDVDPTGGRPVTAEDIAANFERMVTDSPEYVLREMFILVDSVEAVDEKTAQVKLKSPYGQFITNVADVWAKMMPPEIYEGDQAKVRPVGSGPFIFRDAQLGVGQTLDKNPNYHIEGRPYVDGVDFAILADGATIAAAFQSGDLDINRGAAIPIMQQLQNDYPDANYGERFGVMNPFMINNDREPFNNPLVRRAMYHAIDPELITQLSFNGLATRGQPLPVWLTRYQLAEDDLPAYDPAEARSLLEAAGLPDGFSFTNVTFQGATAGFGTLQAQQSLGEVGIEMTNEELEWANWRSNVYGIKGDFEVTIGGEFDYISPDRQLYNAFHSQGSANNRHVNDPDLDALLIAAREELDPDAAAEKYKEVSKYLVDNAISVWLPQNQSIVATQPWVKGWFWQWSAGALFECNYMDEIWIDRD